MTRKAQELLEETISNVTGPRNVAYGSPTKNFQDTADLWNVLFQEKLIGGLFTATDVALAMTALKQARIMNDKSEASRDSWGDLAGYAALGFECVAEDV